MKSDAFAPVVGQVVVGPRARLPVVEGERLTFYPFQKDPRSYSFVALVVDKPTGLSEEIRLGVIELEAIRGRGERSREMAVGLVRAAATEAARRLLAKLHPAE